MTAILELLLPGAADKDIEEPLAHFAAHGWARLGPVANDDALARMRERSDDIMLGKVAYDGMFFQRDTETGRYDDLTYGRGYEGPSLNYRKIEKLEKDALFSAWINNPLFERVARARIAGDIVIYRALLMNKSTAGGSDLPWHQDGGKFWGLDRDPELQIWTARDDAPEDAGCVEVVGGTHVAGLATPLGGVIPDEIARAKDADARAMAVPAAAGEVLLLHNYVWHRSGLNKTGKPRRAITTSYMTAATRCLRRKRAPRVFVRVFG
jgi:phytanoyl-CoA hydroxylase